MEQSRAHDTTADQRRATHRRAGVTIDDESMKSNNAECSGVGQSSTEHTTSKHSRAEQNGTEYTRQGYKRTPHKLYNNTHAQMN